jgi:hypothetical protein
VSREQLRHDAVAGADVAIREAAIADLSRLRDPGDGDQTTAEWAADAIAAIARRDGEFGPAIALLEAAANPNPYVGERIASLLTELRGR